MYLPAYVQYESDTTSSTKTSVIKESALKLNIFAKDLTSEYSIEIAFGTSCAILFIVIFALLIVIWLQRKKIARLMRFFHGHRPDEERLVNLNGSANQNSEESFHDAAVNNQNILHQDIIVNNVVELMFPAILPGFRNITALRAFQKTQREALKEYQKRQEDAFNQNLANARNLANAQNRADALNLENDQNRANAQN